MSKLSGIIREINNGTYNDFKTLGYLNSDEPYPVKKMEVNSLKYSVLLFMNRSFSAPRSYMNQYNNDQRDIAGVMFKSILSIIGLSSVIDNSKFDYLTSQVSREFSSDYEWYEDHRDLLIKRDYRNESIFKYILSSRSYDYEICMDSIPELIYNDLFYIDIQECVLDELSALEKMPTGMISRVKDLMIKLITSKNPAYPSDILDLLNPDIDIRYLNECRSLSDLYQLNKCDIGKLNSLGWCSKSVFETYRSYSDIVKLSDVINMYVES